jgi:hypothetical protein
MTVSGQSALSTCAAGLAKLRRNCHCLTNAYSAGITHSVNTVDDTMPPTIAAAMRLITFEPLPLEHTIASKVRFGERTDPPRCAAQDLLNAQSAAWLAQKFAGVTIG